MADDFSSPAGLIPKLMAAAHRWQQRRGAPPADEGSLPLGRDPTRTELAKAAVTQQAIDASERPNPLDFLGWSFASGPAQAMFMGGKALHAPGDRINKARTLRSKGVPLDEIERRTRFDDVGPGITFGAEGRPRWEISDHKARILDLNPGEKFEGRLDNFFIHPELFDNYPVLKETPTKIRLSPKISGSLISVPGQPPISLELSAPHGELIPGILHELQHAVQSMEGFARGGSSNFMREAAVTELLAPRMQRLGRLVQEAEARGVHINALKRTPTYRQLSDETSQIEEAIRNPREMWRLYSRLAGEVEASNTEWRHPLSLLDRRRLSPEKSEMLATGIPREMQIFRINN